MIGRIREKFFALRRKASAEMPRPAALRGSAHNIIVVKAPNDIFTEAIFVLRDDYYLDPDASSEELLRQARAAAEDYSASVSVRERWKKTLLVVLSTLLVIETTLLSIKYWIT